MYDYESMNSPGFFVMAPCSAGRREPLDGLFLLLKSSQMSSIFTHLTPGLLLIYSINLATSSVYGALVSPTSTLNLPLQHENNMWMPTDVRMYGDWKAKVIVLAIEIVKMVAPQIFDVLRVHPTMRVRSFLDEHHRREVIKVPISGYLDKTGVQTLFEWFHPVGGVLAVVYGRPGVSSPQVIGKTVVMRQAVI